MLNAVALEEAYKKVLHRDALNPPALCDMVYLMGQAQPNEKSVLNRALDFCTARIGLIGYDHIEEVCGYPGFSPWKEKLLALGISPHRIVGIKHSLVEVEGQQIVHTLSELEAMARYAAREGLQRVVLVAPYWHLMRSFMTAILATERHCPSLKIYPALGTPLPWDEPSIRTVKAVNATADIRADFILQETLRLFRYHEQGNLPSAEETLDYMEWRDA